MLSNSDLTSNRIHFPPSHLLRKNLDCMAHRERAFSYLLFCTAKHPFRLNFLKISFFGLLRLFILKNKLLF